VRKILSGILIIFVLLGGLIACKEEEPDSHKGLYGTYEMMEERIEIYFKATTYYVTKSSLHVSKFSEEVNDELSSFITDVIAKAGDTIAIYKNGKIKFSGGSMEREFEYWFPRVFDIRFERTDDFPFYFVNCEKWFSVTPNVWQLETGVPKRINEELYEISFFYSEKDKF